MAEWKSRQVRCACRRRLCLEWRDRSGRCRRVVNPMANGPVVDFPSRGGGLSYEPYFGLNEKPFSLNADPRFLYHSPSHARTFAKLLAGIRRREGLLVLTGEIGTGKTTLCRAVLRGLGRRTYSAFIPDPFASREDLLKMMLIDFGVSPVEDFTQGPLANASRTELSYLLSRALESLSAQDAFAVVIIDEAQNMSSSMIEETRILADSFGGRGQLQILFVGQPELHETLKRPELRQVDQRVYVYAQLAPLSARDVSGYITHRLKVAGAAPDRVLFPADVIDRIHARSGGVPRLVNRICDRALHLAHLRRKDHVSMDVLDAALSDIGPDTLTPTWSAILANGRSSASEGDARERAVAVETEAAVRPRAERREGVGRTGFAGEATFDRKDDWLTLEVATTSGNPASLREFSTERFRLPGMVAKVAKFLGLWAGPDNARRSDRYRQFIRVSARSVLVATAALAIFTAAQSGSCVRSRGPSVQPFVDHQILPARPIVAASAPVALPLAAIANPPAVAPQSFYVAVGVFTAAERAAALHQELARDGFRVSVQPYQLGRRAAQQVLLGPYADRGRALAELRRLQRRGGYDDAHVIEAGSAAAVP
jgi:type II secretory pathway predicted ATPase ExeA/cell division septation protein DedD